MLRYSLPLLNKVGKSTAQLQNVSRACWTKFSYQRKLQAEMPIRLYSSSNIQQDNDDQKTNLDKKKPSMKDKFKNLWKQYGMIAVGTYLTIYISTLGSLFLAVDYDILNAASVGLDPIMAVEKFCSVVELFTGNHSFPEYVRDHPHVGKFGIAWVMTKFTEPLRLAVTIAITPKVGKLLGKATNEKDED